MSDGGREASSCVSVGEEMKRGGKRTEEAGQRWKREEKGYRIKAMEGLAVELMMKGKRDWVREGEGQQGGGW